MKLITNKNILIAAIMVALYFAILFSNTYIFKSDAVLIGVFQEVLTIPMLILQFVVLFLAVKKMIESKTLHDLRLLCASMLMLASVVVTLGSFFI